MKFRELRADEIDVRVGSVSKLGCTILFYKDARCDMNILDETVGSGNWQRDHKEVKGNLYCGVGLWDEKKSAWIWKWDCGTESYTEKEKGEASDSFKRACFNWGIGRELYTAPFTFIKCETELKGDKYYLTKDSQKIINGAFVSDIQYLEGKIVSVTVCSKNGDVLFKKGAEIKQENKPYTPEEVTPGGLDYLTHLIVETGTDIKAVYSYYQVDSLEKLNARQFSHLTKQLEAKLKKK